MIRIRNYQGINRQKTFLKIATWSLKTYAIEGIFVFKDLGPVYMRVPAGNFVAATWLWEG